MPLIAPNYNMEGLPAWGNNKIAFLPANADGTMPDLDIMRYVGYIQDTTTALEYAEGEALELVEEGGIVRARKVRGGTLTMTFNIFTVHQDIASSFWNASVTGTGADQIIRVRSMSNSGNFAIYLEPEDVGAQDLRIPFASVNMGLTYSSAEGFITPCTVTVLTGQQNYMFDIGFKPEPTPTETVVFTSASADGAVGTTSTELTINLGEAVTGLAAGNITLTGTTGATVSAVTGSNPYTATLTGITASGTASVVLNVAGYSFDPPSRDVQIYLAQG